MVIKKLLLTGTFPTDSTELNIGYANHGLGTARRIVGSSLWVADDTTNDGDWKTSGAWHYDILFKPGGTLQLTFQAQDEGEDFMLYLDYY